MKTPRTLLSWFMCNGKTGEVFITTKPDRHATAAAVYYNRSIITERVLMVSLDGTPKAQRATKITLL